MVGGHVTTVPPPVRLVSKPRLSVSGVDSRDDTTRADRSLITPPPRAENGVVLATTLKPSLIKPIQLPVYDWDPIFLKPPPRRRIPFSVIAQCDGLMYSLLGVRVERDVLAPDSTSSYTESWGVPQYTCLSSCVGMYYTEFNHLPTVVAMAMSHRALGLFIVPEWPSHGRLIRKDGKASTPRPWRQHLKENTFLTFRLPGPSMGFPYGLSAVVVGFRYCGQLKKLRRPEKCLEVGILSFPADVASPKLGVIPLVVTRVSPLVEDRWPSAQVPVPEDHPAAVVRKQDTAVATDPFPMSELIPDTPPVPKGIDTTEFARCAAAYPFEDIALLATEVVGDGLQIHFQGDRMKPVVRPNSRRIRGKELSIRSHCIEERDAKRMLGPFSTSPFPCKACPFQPRNVSLGTVKKHKWIMDCPLFRLTSDFSAGGSSATNELLWRPNLISFHCRASHIGDVIASHGKGVRVWAADIPKCFRHQRNPVHLLHLFLYIIETEEFGKEYFVDLMNPFGWRPSEWGWQTVLNVILWYLRTKGVDDMLGYVDNFFRFSGPSHDHDARTTQHMRVFTALGISFHEVQGPLFFKGLGWSWDLERLEMVCAEDKRDAILTRLGEWSLLRAISLKELQQLIGFMTWIVDGFPIGKSDVAPLIHMRTRGERVFKAKNLRAEDVMCPISARAMQAIRFWIRVFTEWNGRCPIRLRFGPTSAWQGLGRVDASTQWGCGGFLFLHGKLIGFLHKWTQEDRDRSFVVQRESTGALELLGAIHWARRFASRCKALRLLLEMDNESSTIGLQAGYSENQTLMDLIGRCRIRFARNHVVLRVNHVKGDRFNLIADHLSHGRVSQAKAQAWKEFGSPLVLVA